MVSNNKVDAIGNLLEEFYEIYKQLNRDQINILLKEKLDKKYEEILNCVNEISDFTEPGEKGATILGYATIFECLPLIKYLIEIKKVNVDFLDNTGGTSLIAAINRHNLDIVKYLVDHGADVNAKSEHGETPLWWALERGSSNIIKYLVSKGANLDYKHPEEDITLREWAKGEFDLDF